MAWVPIAAAAAQGLSSLFGSRSATKAKKAQSKQDFLSEKYFADMKRKNELEDRRYQEEAIGNYRPWQSGGLMSPAMTDPNTVQPVDPYAPKPKK